MKQCSRCWKHKEDSKFRANPKIKDGLHSWCKECEKDYRQEYNSKNKEVLNEKKKKYYLDHKEQIDAKNKKWQKKNYSRHLEHCEKYQSKKRLKKIFEEEKELAELIRKTEEQFSKEINTDWRDIRHGKNHSYRRVC